MAEPDAAQRNCWDKHCHAYCSLCTSIGVGDGKGVVGYLEKAAQLLPDMPEIAAILPLYRELRRLNQAIWDYQGGFMPPSDQMAQREYREAIAGILERMARYAPESPPYFINEKKDRLVRRLAVSDPAGFFAEDGLLFTGWGQISSGCAAVPCRRCSPGL